jgi:dephospho-CoA kinase
VWVTRCSPHRQHERLRVCRGLDSQDAAARIKAQPPQEEKVAQADVVIDTNGLMADTESQFGVAWARLPAPHTVAPIARLSRAEEPVPTRPQPARPKGPRPSAPPETPPAPLVSAPRPDDLAVRRARPSDIPAILLLMQKATNGAMTMKRGELLLALSERGYFIGQIGTEVSTVIGYNIDSQVARIDETYIYPLEMAAQTGAAVLEEIVHSARSHMGQIMIAFLVPGTPAAIREMFVANGFAATEKAVLAPSWQLAVDESQPEGTEFLIKILRDIRAGA